MVVLGVRLRGLEAVLLLILLQKRDDLGQLLRLDLVLFTSFSSFFSVLFD